MVGWLLAFLPIGGAHHHEFVRATTGQSLYASHEDCLICNFVYAGYQNDSPGVDAGLRFYNDYFHFPRQTENHKFPELFSFSLRAPPLI